VKGPDKGAHATQSNGDVCVVINNDYSVFEYLNPDEAMMLADEIKTAALLAFQYERDLAEFHKNRVKA